MCIKGTHNNRGNNVTEINLGRHTKKFIALALALALALHRKDGISSTSQTSAVDE
jgi:hypothetical protein